MYKTLYVIRMNEVIIVRKRYRIKKEKEFQRVFDCGESTANRQLVVYYYPIEDQEHFRVGLSVGKRIGNAVKRNQVKRYLRQALHELSPRIDGKWDIIVIARQGCREQNYHQLKSSLVHVMSLAKILNSNSIQQNSGGMNEYRKNSKVD